MASARKRTGRRAGARLRVELDDQPLVDLDGQRHLGTLRKVRHRTGELAGVPVQVRRRVGRQVQRFAHVHEVLRLVGELDRLAGLDLRARDVDAATLDVDVAVAHELAGLAHGQGEPQPEAHGVEPRLQLADQLLAGDATLFCGAREVPAELLLAHAVDRAELLLLEQAHLVLGEALAPAAVLARRVWPLAGRAIGPTAHGRADAPAHLVTRS